MKNFIKSPPVYISHLQVLTWVWCSWRHTLTKAQKWSQYKTKRYLNIFFFFPGSMESWSISLASLSLLTLPFMLFGNILFWVYHSKLLFSGMRTCYNHTLPDDTRNQIESRLLSSWWMCSQGRHGHWLRSVFLDSCWRSFALLHLHETAQQLCLEMPAWSPCQGPYAFHSSFS